MKIHWWNNGTDSKMQDECPGAGWTSGRLKVTDAQKKKMSTSHKGKVWWNKEGSNTMSIECPGDGWIHGRDVTHRQWYNDGNNEIFQVKCPIGWTKGRLKFSEEACKNIAIAQQKRAEKDKHTYRIGEELTMKNGLKAKITGYQNAQHMIVTFENGTILTGATYHNFRSRQLRCPMTCTLKGNYYEVINPNLKDPKPFLVDVEDLPLALSHYWAPSGNGYMCANGIGYLHRLIVNADSKMHVDHHNRNILDNRRSNLRLCTKSQNAMNAKKPLSNTSGYKGVDFNKKANKWRARIGLPGGAVHLGWFSIREDAARAYNEAAIKYYKEFARLNVIPEGIA